MRLPLSVVQRRSCVRSLTAAHAGISPVATDIDGSFIRIFSEALATIGHFVGRGEEENSRSHSRLQQAVNTETDHRGEHLHQRHEGIPVLVSAAPPN